MEDVITSYTKAEYYIDGINEPIRIGDENLEIKDLLKQTGTSSWCFITAWNPLSGELSGVENVERNIRLRTELSEYRVLEGEGRDPGGTWQPERSFFVAGISLKAAKSLAIRFGQRAIVYGERDKPAKLVETLFTQGKCELIRLPKTAFLCSRKIPASIVLKCYDWAIAQREAGNCIISGFHSKIEKDVLHYLLKGSQPIIVALARGLKMRLEPELVKPLKDGRLLIISPFDSTVIRAGELTASIRNKLMLDLAGSAVIGHASPGGALERLMKITELSQIKNLSMTSE